MPDSVEERMLHAVHIKISQFGMRAEMMRHSDKRQSEERSRKRLAQKYGQSRSKKIINGGVEVWESSIFLTGLTHTVEPSV